jgi:hypothetical protein
VWLWLSSLYLAFVFTATVRLDAVLGAFNTRDEHEIVVDPAFLDRVDQLD